MKPELQAVFWLLGACGILIVIKAARAVRTDAPYTFKMWDGGMIRAGKSLTRMGARVKLVTASLLCAGSAVVASGLYPHQAMIALSRVLVASFTFDFALAAK